MSYQEQINKKKTGAAKVEAKNSKGKPTYSTKLLFLINPFSANFTKWSNTLKQFVGSLPTNCLSVFDYFWGLALKGLTFDR